MKAKSYKFEESLLMDPLMLSVELPLRVRLYPRGFPINIATNSPLVVAAARESWDFFPQGFHEPEIELRIAVDQGDDSPLPAEPVFRAQKHLLAVVAGPGNFAVCDMAGTLGFGWLSGTVAASRAYLRYHFLEAMAYTILEHRCLTSVHAGCVALNGRGVLLFGSSGAGKSCLSFACARQGWTLIDDDASSLVRGLDSNIVLGDPYHLRFRSSAVELFPDLEELPLSTTREGELSIEVFTRRMPEIATALQVPVERVVFLERRNTSIAELLPVSATEALRRMEAELPLFDQRVDEEHKASLLNLLRTGPQVLRYNDLDSAVQKLEELLS
jgi:hypothetical protein